ncbi:MAG: flavin-containing monooxygenase [Marmoricola sp.]
MTTDLLPSRVATLVVGAGFAGLATASELDRAGYGDLLVIDKGREVGGTWRDNIYPGAACDVPSQLYSFSFAPNPSWSRSFSPQPEIQQYLRDVATGAGVLDRFRFGVTLLDASWDDDEQVWHAETTNGPVVADTLVTGSGGLSEPKLPEIDGIEAFEGTLFHTARWDHDVDLAGKRVAVIGTGASAIQVVPAIAGTVGHLDLYQRTAPWVMPRHDRAYTAVERAMFRLLPPVQRAYRTAIYWGLESRVPMFAGVPVIGSVVAEAATRIATANIAKGITDPELRAKVTPDFRIGCKRVLISNDYYPALARDNVDVVTDRIARITPTGIVTADGTERPVDVLIVATGFHTTEQPIAEHVKGREGRTLADAWREGGMAAYKGTTIHGFPNLFQIVGPNTGLGHSSMVFIIESQVRYIVSALQEMGARGLGAVEPKAASQRRWNDDLHRRMARTVWNTGGCASWYLDEHGRNTTLWPRATFRFRQLLSHFDVEAYDVTPRTTDTKEHAA